MHVEKMTSEAFEYIIQVGSEVDNQILYQDPSKR
jgi:hypothetical protein